MSLTSERSLENPPSIVLKKARADEVLPEEHSLAQ